MMHAVLFSSEETLLSKGVFSMSLSFWRSNRVLRKLSQKAPTSLASGMNEIHAYCNALP